MGLLIIVLNEFSSKDDEQTEKLKANKGTRNDDTLQDKNDDWGNKISIQLIVI